MPDDFPDRLVVDASVGIKWVIDEPGSDQAVAVVSGRRLITSSLFWIETANVLATKVRKGELSRASASDAWRDLSDAPLEIIDTGPSSIERALTLAHDLQHPVYDCVYLALAIEMGCPVVTADKRFVASVSGSPILAGKVLFLYG